MTFLVIREICLDHDLGIALSSAKRAVSMMGSKGQKPYPKLSTHLIISNYVASKEEHMVSESVTQVDPVTPQVLHQTVSTKPEVIKTLTSPAFGLTYTISIYVPQIIGTSIHDIHMAIEQQQAFYIKLQSLRLLRIQQPRLQKQIDHDIIEHILQPIHAEVTTLLEKDNLTYTMAIAYLSEKLQEVQSGASMNTGKILAITQARDLLDVERQCSHDIDLTPPTVWRTTKRQYENQNNGHASANADTMARQYTPPNQQEENDSRFQTSIYCGVKTWQDFENENIYSESCSDGYRQLHIFAKQNTSEENNNSTVKGSLSCKAANFYHLDALICEDNHTTTVATVEDQYPLTALISHDKLPLMIIEGYWIKQACEWIGSFWKQRYSTQAVQIAINQSKRLHEQLIKLQGNTFDIVDPTMRCDYQEEIKWYQSIVEEIKVAYKTQQPTAYPFQKVIDEIEELSNDITKICKVSRSNMNRQ